MFKVLNGRDQLRSKQSAITLNTQIIAEDKLVG